MFQGAPKSVWDSGLTINDVILIRFLHNLFTIKSSLSLLLHSFYLIFKIKNEDDKHANRLLEKF